MGSAFLARCGGGRFAHPLYYHAKYLPVYMPISRIGRVCIIRLLISYVDKLQVEVAIREGQW